MSVRAAEQRLDMSKGARVNLLSHYCRHFTGAFKFKNRQGRTFFWLCLLADVFLVSGLVALSPFGLLGRLLILLALLVIAGNAIQRLKDAGVTPWMLLLWFIPFVGLAILAILLLLPGRKPVDLPVAPPSSPYVGGK